MMNPKSVDQLDPRNYIIVKGAKLHNLKNIDVAIRRNELTVVTGLSGSGKSSLVFDTLYAEGQRTYVESLSSYARQFLGRMKKPEVDYIKGICPAVAIEQKVVTRTSRSTVGTSTEIYDYIKLLFARIGKTYSPISGNEVKKHTVADVINAIVDAPADSKIYICCPVQSHNIESFDKALTLLLQKGFTKLITPDGPEDIEAILDRNKDHKNDEIFLLIDRLIKKSPLTEEALHRLSDSVQTAFYEGGGIMHLLINDQVTVFSDRFELDGLQFEIPSVNLFTFSNPYGACKTCEGFGTTIGLDKKLIIPDETLSVYDGCVLPWRSEKFKNFNDEFIRAAIQFDFPVHRTYSELTQSELDLLWNGNNKVAGIWDFFKMLEEQAYKIQYRVMLSRYKGRTTCPECKGSRLRKDASYVKLLDIKSGMKWSINEMLTMQVDELQDVFLKLKLSEKDQIVANRLLIEINNRIGFLNSVGLGYLTLNRLSNTLSGGESQRIRLATSLGSSLVGSMYILDEPSIGLHPSDNDKLIAVLIALKQQGNTLIVVEHEESVMRSADQIIDIGPGAGYLGGHIVWQGTLKDMLTKGNTLTAQYLKGEEKIPVPEKRGVAKSFIHIEGAKQNNLQNVNATFPLGIKTVVTGVSGSGKTTLVKQILYPALKKQLVGYQDEMGNFDRIYGDFRDISDTELIDQNPIGKTTRSNPVTYIKAFDLIRDLFADTQAAKIHQYKPGFFSFNTEGGRCETCQGEGTVTIEMQFLADVVLECESCKGKRYKQEVLDITINDKNIFDVLEMTVLEAITFFSGHKQIVQKLNSLKQVGLDYIKLGQSSATLSGGEAQRIKLASYLTKGNSVQPILFIFDEPTTGLHFHDIRKLNKAFDLLIEKGHSILIIEHNQEIIKCADWIIDLGPGGGKNGGQIVYAGPPEGIIKAEKSLTGKYLAEKLN